MCTPTITTVSLIYSMGFLMAVSESSINVKEFTHCMASHILISLSHQARFILILLVGSFDVICAIILVQSQSMMAFRVGGALESLQSQYFMMNLCFSMLTFDLQAQV